MCLAPWHTTYLTSTLGRFAEAMEAMDTGKRLSAITTLLGAEEVPVEEKADLLDDLTEIVENIDHARDLHSVGGLPALVRLLSSPESELRWRAAGVVAAACQSNPPVRSWAAVHAFSVTLPPGLLC